MYEKNFDFQELAKLIKADDFICAMLSLYISFFEKALKNFLSNVYAQKLHVDSKSSNNYSQFKRMVNEYEKAVEDTQAYDLLALNRMYTTKGKRVKANDNTIHQRIRVVKKVLELGDNRKAHNNNYLISHYQKHHFPIPIWIIFHGLTLGELIYLYNFLKLEDRSAFCAMLTGRKKIRPADISRIGSLFHRIRQIRNTINHYEPIMPMISNVVDENDQKNFLRTIELLVSFYEQSCMKNITISSLERLQFKGNHHNIAKVRLLNVLLRKL